MGSLRPSEASQTVKMLAVLATDLVQSEQVVNVVIKDFTFVTKQGALRLGLPTVITIHNEDGERHDYI